MMMKAPPCSHGKGVSFFFGQPETTLRPSPLYDMFILLLTALQSSSVLQITTSLAGINYPNI